MSAVLQAVDLLNDRLLAAHAVGEALALAADPDRTPAWVTVYQSQVEAITAAAEALETLIRRGSHVQG